MNLPKMEACGNFVREARTPENPACFAVAEIPLYAQSNASGIAAEIVLRCNEYDELKARIAELEAELSAKSRDTDRINWLDLQFRDDSDWQRVFYGATSNYSLRATIDAAHKNSAETPENRAACEKIMDEWAASECVEKNHPDTERIDAIYRESWDLECFDYSTGMDDKEIGWRVVEHHQASPNKRTVAEVFVDDPRKAIDAARKNGGAA